MKTVFLEVAIPEHVTHIAQDETGRWCGYSSEPKPYHIFWNGPGAAFICQGPPNPNWRETLREVE